MKKTRANHLEIRQGRRACHTAQSNRKTTQLSDFVVKTYIAEGENSIRVVSTK